MLTKILLTLVAVVLFAVGVVFDFAPQEAASALNLDNAALASVLLQVLAGACFGFSILNWFARNNPMGGIYAKPLALGNLLFFLVAAIPLARAATHGHQLPAITIAAIVSSLFAVAFVWITFFHDPLGSSKSQSEQK